MRYGCTVVTGADAAGLPPLPDLLPLEGETTTWQYRGTVQEAWDCMARTEDHLRAQGFAITEYRLDPAQRPIDKHPSWRATIRAERPTIPPKGADNVL